MQYGDSIPTTNPEIEGKEPLYPAPSHLIEAPVYPAPSQLHEYRALYTNEDDSSTMSNLEEIKATDHGTEFNKAEDLKAYYKQSTLYMYLFNESSKGHREELNTSNGERLESRDTNEAGLCSSLNPWDFENVSISQDPYNFGRFCPVKNSKAMKRVLLFF